MANAPTWSSGAVAITKCLMPKHIREVASGRLIFPDGCSAAEARCSIAHERLRTWVKRRVIYAATQEQAHQPRPIRRRPF